MDKKSEHSFNNSTQSSTEQQLSKYSSYYDKGQPNINDDTNNNDIDNSQQKPSQVLDEQSLSNNTSSQLQESDQNIQDAIKRFQKLIKQRQQLKLSITQQLKTSITSNPPTQTSSSLNDIDNEGQILKKIHKNQQALPFSASPFKKAKAPTKTREYYVKLLKTKLQHIEEQGEEKSVFLSQKEFLLQEITDIARYMDYEDCNCHIIPALKALVNSGVIIIQRLLTRLPDLADVIINELSGHQLKGLAFVTSQIFPIIEACFIKHPIQNPQSLAQCINKLVQLNDHQILRNNIQNMVMKLYNQAFQTMQQDRQIGALVLLQNQQILDIFTPNKLDSFIKSQMKVLSNRCVSFKLQKALIPFICSLSKRNICVDLFSQFLFPVYIKFLKDEELWGLQKVAIQGIDSIAKNVVSIGNYQWIQSLIDCMDDGLKSQSKWVRIEAFKIMPKFLVAVLGLRSTIGIKQNNQSFDLGIDKKIAMLTKKPTSQNLNSLANCSQPQQKWKVIECRIVSSVLSMVQIAQLNKDNVSLINIKSNKNQILYDIAYNFPSLIYLTSNSNKANKLWQQYFQPLHRKLSNDSDYNIKRTIASSLHQVAKLIIQNNQKKKDIDTKSKSAYFIQLVSSFLSDLDEVQLACLRQLPSLLKLIASDTILDGSPKQVVLFLYERFDTRMITQVKSQILPQLCEIFLADVVAQLMEKSFIGLVKNQNWLVRKNACKAFGPFYLRMQKLHTVLNQSCLKSNRQKSICQSFEINSDDSDDDDDNSDSNSQSNQKSDLMMDKSKILSSTKNTDLSRRYSSIAAQSALQKYCNPFQFSDKYQERISYIWMIQSLVKSYVRKGIQDDAQCHMQQLIALSNDKVVCVRLAIVNALDEILNSQFSKKCEGIIPKVKEYLAVFKKDQSSEIQNICNRNLVGGGGEDEIMEQNVVKQISICANATNATHIYNEIDPLQFRFIQRELEFTTSQDFQFNDSSFETSQPLTSNFQELLKQAAKLTEESVDVNAYLKKLVGEIGDDLEEEKGEKEEEVEEEVQKCSNTTAATNTTPRSVTSQPNEKAKTNVTKNTIQTKSKVKEKQSKLSTSSTKSKKSQIKINKKQQEISKSQGKSKQISSSSSSTNSKLQRNLVLIPPSHSSTARPLSAYTGKGPLYKLSVSTSTKNSQASRINSASTSEKPASSTKPKSLSHQNSNRGRLKLPITNILPPLSNSKKQPSSQRSKFMRKYSQQEQTLTTSNKNSSTLSLSASTTSTNASTTLNKKHNFQQLAAFSSNKQNIKREINCQFK